MAPFTTTFRYAFGITLEHACIDSVDPRLDLWDGNSAVDWHPGSCFVWSQKTAVRTPNFSGCVWHFPDGIGCEQRRGCHGGKDRGLVMWSTLQARGQSLVFRCPARIGSLEDVAETIGNLHTWGFETKVSPWIFHDINLLIPKILADVSLASGRAEDCVAIDASRCRIRT